MNKHAYTNELIEEKSPYLLQHAHNPVNWYPWGDKPFQIAKEKNIDRTEIGTILEELFKSLIERQYGSAENCDVIVNIERGELEIYKNKEVVE